MRVFLISRANRSRTPNVTNGLRPFVSSLSLLALSFAPFCSAQTRADWPVYNGGLDGDHYSGLTQINRDNVHLLQQAWTYDTGEKGAIQTNPLIVGGTLYAYTPKTEVIALDAATGKLKWKFDSGIVAGHLLAALRTGMMANAAASTPG